MRREHKIKKKESEKREGEQRQIKGKKMLPSGGGALACLALSAMDPPSLAGRPLEAAAWWWLGLGFGG
ncbi:hypothetical protein DY000_02044674 [Brassica cretica]|uniref:Uncharacterized protein n=1 Tax=Brassica cretica TaxID=69181 RepID=A0ABQ7ENB1_BRACR|nr:hypothetical protein DY000_02044674 [Brassica cretica]